MTDCKTTCKYTEQLLYKHDLSGNTCSDIRSSEVITTINRILLSKMFINLHESFKVCRGFPSIFSGKELVTSALKN